MIPSKSLVVSELHQLALRLSNALEAWDDAMSDEFNGVTRGEIRAEIARKTAALIHQARHGIWNASALRDAVRSWQLLKRVEENIRADCPKLCSVGDSGPDFIWRRGERLFVDEGKCAPLIGEGKLGPGSGRTKISL